MVALDGLADRRGRDHKRGMATESDASHGDNSSGPPALFENPLHLRAAAVVVAHQVVDRPAYVLVAALFARLELIGDIGAVALALPHDAGAERALLALVFGEARFEAERRDGIGEVLGVHGALGGAGARMRPRQKRRVAQERDTAEHGLR